MKTIPSFFAKFIVDFIETALAAVFLLNIAFPTSVQDIKQTFLIIGVAVFSALVSAFRRSVPDFIAWLKGKLSVENG